MQAWHRLNGLNLPLRKANASRISPGAFQHHEKQRLENMEVTRHLKNRRLNVFATNDLAVQRLALEDDPAMELPWINA